VIRRSDRIRTLLVLVGGLTFARDMGRSA